MIYPNASLLLSGQDSGTTVVGAVCARTKDSSYTVPWKKWVGCGGTANGQNLTVSPCFKHGFNHDWYSGGQVFLSLRDILKSVTEPCCMIYLETCFLYMTSSHSASHHIKFAKKSDIIQYQSPILLRHRISYHVMSHCVLFRFYHIVIGLCTKL